MGGGPGTRCPWLNGPLQGACLCCTASLQGEVAWLSHSTRRRGRGISHDDEVGCDAGSRSGILGLSTEKRSNQIDASEEKSKRGDR